jgi:membrane protease YdiL (CAAX protease family)
MPTLVGLLLLPLAIILAQIAIGATGGLANGVYKLAFLIPPIVYCRLHGIQIGRDIFRWQNWRNHLGLSIVLGLMTAAIFVALYAAIGPLLVDKAAIAAKIQRQFGVTAGTVLLIAPWTIVVNSLIEEFFYRGFAFGLIGQRRPLLATLLPAAVFAVQHLLFAYHWVGPGTVVLGVAALFVFSLVAQAMYVASDTIVAPWIIHICGDLAMMGIAVELIHNN